MVGGTQIGSLVGPSGTVQLLRHLADRWTAVIQSNTIPTKRMEFSARRTCVNKRMRISDLPMACVVIGSFVGVLRTRFRIQDILRNCLHFCTLRSKSSSNFDFHVGR